MAQDKTQGTRRRRARPWPKPVLVRAAEYYGNETPKETHRLLLEQFGEAHVPAVVKTVRRWFDDWRENGFPRELQQNLLRETVADVPPDASGAWSPAEATGQDSRIVLDVLAELIRSTGGSRTFVTRAEAEWLVRLFYAAPGLHPMLSWRLAQAYIQRLDRDEPTEDLDVWVSFAPWLSDERLEAYERLKPAAPRYELVKAGEAFRSERAKEAMHAQGINPDDLTTRPTTTTRESARSLHWLLRVLQTKIKVVLQEAEGRRLVLSPYHLHGTTDQSGAPPVYVREMPRGNLGVSSGDGRKDAFAIPEELQEGNR